MKKANNNSIAVGQSNIKLPSIARSKSQIIQISPRKKSWSQKYAMNEMPQHSPIKGKKSESYQRILTKSTIQPSQNYLKNHKKPKLEKKTRREQFSTKKIQLVQFLKSKYTQCDQQILDTIKLMKDNSIPDYFQYYTLKSLTNLQHIKDSLIKLDKSIKSKQHIYFKIIASIQARKKFVQDIRLFVSSITPEEILGKKTEYQNGIKALRLLTLSVIDNIQKWRDSIPIEDQKPIFFIDHECNINILLQILNDTSFILTSSLSHHVNMGTKNDPLFLSPIKKGMGKQDSPYIQIFSLQKPYQYYFKYMEYLASEKAYQIHQEQQIKSPQKKMKIITQIDKIYRNKLLSHKKGKNDRSHGYISQNQFISYDQVAQQKISAQKQKQMEQKKARLQRLSKNQERINFIKNVYQPDHKRKKHAKSDIELSRLKISQGLQKIQNSIQWNKISPPKSPQIKPSEDSEFDSLVHKKYKKQAKIQTNNASAQLKVSSPHKTPSKQEQMIENVKDIEKKLKLKLQEINNDDHTVDNKKYVNKSQKQIVNSLKSQIIQKIQGQNAQKNMQKQKRREQQMRMLDDIKQKMKRDMNERLEQKKKQKLMQRQELEKKLKQQEQRFKKQRELQMQFQAKLSKQRQLRQIEKFKRQAAERQQQLKQQLQRQTKLRKQKQQAIERQKQQKQEIMKRIQRKQIEGQLENQIREHVFVSKEGYQINSAHNVDKQMDYAQDKSIVNISQLENKKQQQESKGQMQESNIFENSKIEKPIDNKSILSVSNKSRQIGSANKNNQFQNQQANKIQPILSKEDIKKQKAQQLRLQIQLIKEKQRKQMEIFQKEIQLRQRMLKVKLTEQQLNEKQIQNLVRAAILEERKGRKSEALEYLPEVRKKVQQQMRIEQQQQMQHQKAVDKINQERRLQEQQYRKKIREKIEKQLRIQAISKTKKQIQTRQSKQLHQKKQLHQNFIRRQQQLPLRSRVIEKPENEEQINREIENRILLKQQKQQGAKSSLRARFERQLLSSFQPNSYLQPQKNHSYILKNTNSYLDDNYLYNKLETNKQKDDPVQLNHVVLSKSQVREYKYDMTDEQLHVYSKQKKVILDKQNEQRPQNSQLAKDIPKKKKIEDGFQLMEIKEDENDEDEKKFAVKVVANGQIKKQKAAEKPEKKKILTKKKKSDDDKDSEDDQQYKKAKKPSKKKKVVKKETSQSEVSAQSEQEKPKKKKKQVKNKKKQVKNKKSDLSQIDSQQDKEKIVYYDAEEKEKQRKERQKKRFQNLPQVTIKKIKPKADNFRFSLEVQAMPEGDLDQYMQNHFLRLPDSQTQILPMDRQELYRKLTNQLTFCLLLGQFQNRLMGMAYIYHDRSKTEIRKLVIAHISTYDNSHLKQFILTVFDYLFRKDPCDEIQFIYQFNEMQERQAGFAKDFNLWFDQHGHIYQKKLDTNIYERKYVYKRQFNQECQVVLRGINKNSFNSIFSLYSGVLMSDAGLSKVKDQLNIQTLAEDWISYGVMISELFRNYMSPDDAQILKNKVKQIPKLKELLVLVVMLQKKKMRLDDLKLSSYKTLIELNMKLMSQGKQVIRYAKDSGVEYNELFYSELNFGLNLPFGFQTTSLPTQLKQDEVRQVSYFRLNPLPSYKLQLLKSSLYNSQMHILPTQNSKTKLFLLNAQQYLELRKSSKIDLFMYIRYFMKNVRSHSTAAWKYIWIPEMLDKDAWNISQFQSYLKKDIYVHDHISLSYRQFLPSALIIQPQHRDLVITPPFIVGVLSMGLQQISEGSPIYARLIDADCLKTLEVQKQ